MAGLIEKGLLASLGVLTLTRDKVVQFVNQLVEEGEVKPEEAPSIIDRLVERGEAEKQELHKLVQKELDKVRISVPLVPRKDIKELSHKIDELAARVEELTEKKSAKKQAD